mmetsp:Transcript_30079/g.70119  ORF Transcript_30079/g.70119 Transcript_30079/m.70119 type:complete len:205 (-) Transcript_30079:901-1515(-)
MHVRPELTRKHNLHLDVQVAKAGRIISERHPLAFDLQHLQRPSDTRCAHLNYVAVQVLDLLAPAEKCLPKRDLHAHMQVVAPPLELLVLSRLQGEDDSTRNHSRPLLCHARECHLLTISHALLNMHVELGILLLALLLAGYLLLLLNDHSWAHLLVDHLHLVWTPLAALTLRRVRPGAAPSAHNSPAVIRLASSAVVEVFQCHC